MLGGLLIAWQGEVNGIRWAFVAALVLAIIALIIQQALVADFSCLLRGYKYQHSQRPNNLSLTNVVFLLIIHDILSGSLIRES
jgi:uncharacterized membrane protein